MTELHVGFTGTQEGVSLSQRHTIRHTLTAWHDAGHEIVLHHGDCVGADMDVHMIGALLGRVVVHPPENESKRAFCRSAGQVAREPLPYITRNHAIVNESHVLLACPQSDVEMARSGTWATVRYAARHLDPDLVWVIKRDGTPIRFRDLKEESR